jgi:hypothetical protein
VDRLCNEWLDEESVEELLFLEANIPASRTGGYKSKLLSPTVWPSCSPHLWHTTQSIGIEEVYNQHYGQ